VFVLGDQGVFTDMATILPRWVRLPLDRAFVVLLVALVTAACGGGGDPVSSPGSPTSPTAIPAPPAGSPRLLLAGQSGAYFLQPYLANPLAEVNIDGNIDYWLSSERFGTLARTTGIDAFVWWQGSGDAGRLSTEEYAAKLRQLIAVVRASHPQLPVRVMEIADFPIRAAVKEAQRQVATDPNVQMIPTADLPLDSTGHHLPSGYVEIRDRISRSLGR
jgi:hypothetical protein